MAFQPWLFNHNVETPRSFQPPIGELRDIERFRAGEEMFLWLFVFSWGFAGRRVLPGKKGVRVNFWVGMCVFVREALCNPNWGVGVGYASWCFVFSGFPE